MKRIVASALLGIVLASSILVKPASAQIEIRLGNNARYDRDRYESQKRREWEQRQQRERELQRRREWEQRQRHERDLQREREQKQQEWRRNRRY